MDYSIDANTHAVLDALFLGVHIVINNTEYFLCEDGDGCFAIGTLVEVETPKPKSRSRKKKDPTFETVAVTLDLGEFIEFCRNINKDYLIELKAQTVLRDAGVVQSR